MIAAMKNCELKQQNKMTTQRKERKKDISLYWSKLQVLQFYKFLVNSRIKDGVWYKLSCLKTLIRI